MTLGLLRGLRRYKTSPGAIQSPEDIPAPAKSWSKPQKITGCLALAGAGAAGLVAIPWGEALSYAGLGFQFLINFALFKPSVVFGATAMLLLSLFLLQRNNIIKVDLPFISFLIGATSFVSFFPLMMFSESAGYPHIQILRSPESVSDRSPHVDTEIARRWKEKEFDGKTWITTEMPYVECASFLKGVHEDRDYDSLNLFVNGDIANYSNNATPRQSCSRVLDNEIAQLVATGKNGSIVLTVSD